MSAPEEIFDAVIEAARPTKWLCALGSRCHCLHLPEPPTPGICQHYHRITHVKSQPPRHDLPGAFRIVV